MSNPSLRYIKLLELIPRDPDGVTVREIIRKLEADPEFSAAHNPSAFIRRIQCDLNFLSSSYPLLCKEDGRSKIWSWDSESPAITIPALDLNTSLMLLLARNYLNPILPPGILHSLTKLIRKAEERLAESGGRNKNKGAYTWRDKVAFAPAGVMRKLPSIDHQIESAIYDALLNEKAIKVRYQAWNSRDDQEYIISPAGLVVRNQLIYLVSKDHGDERLRHRLIHRFIAVESTAEPFLRAESFKAQRYVDEGNFGFKLNRHDSRFQLKIRLGDQPLTGVRECPISNDQKIQSLEDDMYLLTATVDNTLELHQWLRSHAHHVEIMSPQWLRDEFAESAKAMMSLYST